MIRLVWLFLFITVYWWSNSSGSTPAPQSFNEPASNTYLLSTIVGTFVFFVFVVGLYRFTSLKQKLKEVNLNTFKFVGGVISIISAYCFYQLNFDLGIIFSFSLMVYSFLFKSDILDHFFDIFQRVKISLGAVSENVGLFIIALLIVIAFTFNFVYLTFSLTLVLLVRFFKNNKHNPFAKYFKNKEYNEMIREYHRPKEFPILYHLINIILITLILSLAYPIILKVVFNQTLNARSFFKTVGYLVFVVITLNFLYNVYIIWFSNFASRQAAAETTLQGFKALIGLTAFEFVLEEINIMEPTSVSKVPRKVLGGQVFESSSQKDFHQALNANLPVNDRDKFFTTMGVYGPPGTNYPFANPATLLERKLALSKKLAPTSASFENDGTTYQLLTTYQLYDPELARKVADEKKSIIEGTASQAEMERIYPMLKATPMVSGEVTHKHEVNLKPLGIGFSKK